MNKLYITIPVLLMTFVLSAEPKKFEKGIAAKAAQTRLDPLSGTANVIANNASDGVLLTNSTDNNVVQNNAIGTNLSGQLNMGNGGAGVHISVNSSNNLIGSTNALFGNLIAFNHKGVIVGDSPADLSVGNAIINNSIYNNTLPGIDLANDGPTPNHTTSPTTGPNDFQNFPVITALTLSGTGLVISWTLNSVPNSEFLLQFFTNNVGDPEGKRVIANVTATTDANGNASGTVTVGTVPLNTPITATATRIISEVGRDTSEFSNPFTFGVANPCPVTCDND
jgi:hypothetical protein